MSEGIKSTGRRRLKGGRARVSCRIIPFEGFTVGLNGVGRAALSGDWGGVILSYKVEKFGLDRVGQGKLD